MAEAAIGRCLHEEDANALHERYENRMQALIAGRTGGAAAAGAAATGPRRRTPAPRRKPKRRVPRARARARRKPVPMPIAADPLPREIGTEILLRLIDIGDRRFDGPGWAGMPGSARRVEAISIRPRDELAPDAVEFRVFAPEGRATPWVSNGNYAGTSGRQLALTGFAARPQPEIGERFDVVYEGWFAEGGAVGPLRNGESCLSPVPDDPIEALRVSFIERRTSRLPGQEPAPAPPPTAAGSVSHRSTSGLISPPQHRGRVMKIKSVEARWVHIPIPPERQHVSDFGRTLSFDGTLVRIETECGLIGWGEAKAQVGGMAQNQALTCMINEEFAPLLKGEDPRDITRLWETLYSGTRGHYALREGRVFPVLGRRGITVSAIIGRRLRAVGHPGQVARPAGVAAARRPPRREDAGLCLGRLGRAGQDRRAAAGLCRGRRVRRGQDARRHHRRRPAPFGRPRAARRARRSAPRSG